MNDATWKIWKTLDGVSKSQNVEYLFETNNQEEAHKKFQDVLKGNIEKAGN